MIFETRFVNKRDSAVRVFEYGRELIRLQPGEARHVESRSPKTSWARWSVVKFSGDDKVSFDENKDWRWPWPDKLMLEFVNIDGTASEGLMIAGQVYQSDKNIPKLIPISPRDTSWCFIQKIERKLVEHKIREGDYYIKKKILEDVKTLRSRKECRDIEKQLLLEVTEKAKAEMKRNFPKAENGEEAEV
jgi:hypothetical protein